MLNCWGNRKLTAEQLAEVPQWKQEEQAMLDFWMPSDSI